MIISKNMETIGKVRVSEVQIKRKCSLRIEKKCNRKEIKRAQLHVPSEYFLSSRKYYLYSCTYLNNFPSRSTASSDTKCWLSLFENLVKGFLECRPKIPSKWGSSSRSYLSKYSNKSSVPKTWKSEKWKVRKKLSWDWYVDSDQSPLGTARAINQLWQTTASIQTTHNIMTSPEDNRYDSQR